MEQLKIGFIGLGLIGGSIAKAIRKFHPDYTLYAYAPSESTLEMAIKDGTINSGFSQFDGRLVECDYIFLCAPVSNNIDYLNFLKTHIKPTCIITDVGSVKGDIHRAVATANLERNFIGGHPMAGSEKTGYANARDYLIENAYYIVTPSESIGIGEVSAFMELISSLGAIPMILTHEEHDYITAAISHLPHIIASSLVNLVHFIDTEDSHMKTIAAGGFKDLTRIASASADIWQQICVENSENISKVLDEYIKLLVQARCFVDQHNEAALYNLFNNAKEFRDSVPESSLGPIKKVYMFYCDLYDEAGGIATIATLLANHRISIKNIGIINNREFEEGVLKIEFYDEDSCNAASQVLTTNNYTLHLR